MARPVWKPLPDGMSQERGRRRRICMREHDKETVVVIGAGLAGLTAAATAARARRPVVVVEAHTAGGRARTDELGGYRFNQGPHALGRGGEAWRILRQPGGAPPRSPTATARRPRRARRQAGRGANRPAGLTAPQAADGIRGELGGPERRRVGRVSGRKS